MAGRERFPENKRRPNERLSSLDRVVTALVMALIVFTPFALGSVYPWPAALIQIGVGVLAILWAVKVAAGAGSESGVTFCRFLRFVPPAALLAVLFTLQLIPLPPAALRAVSPNTYQIYARSLPGWPRTTPYGDSAFLATSAPSAVRPEGAVPPTLREVRQGAPAAFAENARERIDKTDVRLPYAGANVSVVSRSWARIFPAAWRPLAIAPALTMAALLRFAAYAGLFFAIVGYPFVRGSEGERRFYRATLVAVLVTGIMVAAIGLMERVYWNGRILWLFVPMDWGRALVGSLPRATGPFVNPDHFANYLTMIFPLALAGAFYELYSRSRRSAAAVRMLCAVGAFVILSAIVLSLSRAAWFEATASAVVLSLFWARDEWSRWRGRCEGRMLRRGRESSAEEYPRAPWFAARSSTVPIAAAGVSAALALGLVAIALIGPRGRMQSEARLERTIASGGGLGLRPNVWKDSVKILRDFPLMGVGLGGWPEIFPRYQTGPWNEYYFREAHNDYLQYADETGLAGLLALAWFLGVGVVSIATACRRLSPPDRPLMIALGLALASMALHETVDFCLHIPAIALLLTLLFALAVRIGLTATRKDGSGAVMIGGHRWRLRAAAAGVAVAGVVLIIMALTQPGVAYPYDVERASFPAQARAIVIEHPASAEAHMALLDLAGPNMTTAMRVRELGTAVWLDPTNPAIRDRYAETLGMLGKEKESLDEVTESVFNSPAPGTHAYLDKRLIPWLLPAEQKAVEQGFMKAEAAGYPGAISALGGFYDSLGDLSDEVRLFAQAASGAHNANQQASYFTDAAEASVRADDRQKAKELFRKAIEAAPTGAEAYVGLIVQVDGSAKDIRAAEAAAQEGIRNGADPVRLYTALATAARMGGNEALAEKALMRTLQYNPSFSMIMRVAEFDLELNHAERAASMLRNAVEINPASAHAFYLLGVAEEREYQYSRADRAYARAAALAPRQFGSAYSNFRRRVSGSGSNS